MPFFHLDVEYNTSDATDAFGRWTKVLCLKTGRSHQFPRNTIFTPLADGRVRVSHSAYGVPVCGPQIFGNWQREGDLLYGSSSAPELDGWELATGVYSRLGRDLLFWVDCK
jgi:hypothetical protein